MKESRDEEEKEDPALTSKKKLKAKILRRLWNKENDS